MLGKRCPRSPRGLFIGAMSLLFLLAGCGGSGSGGSHDNNASANDQALTIATQKGKVKGVRRDGMREFLGMPYAAPPLGDLRWQPPQPADSWSDVRAADKFADHCPQNASPFGNPSTTEDCLYLNVFAPDDTRQHPVMFFIHGGAGLYGESNDFNPRKIVDQGIVVVTINYRLGALGFLAHPALTAASSNNESGDYGLMDQQAALQWVQRNIDGFGGTPGNVTLFGQSAGGLSVASQLVAPTSQGLFEKAIIESGSYSLALPGGQPTLASAEDQGKVFAQNVGCTDQSRNCLDKLDVQKILDTQGTKPTRFIPNTGTSIAPKSIADALSQGDFNQVPVIEGTNKTEWRLFVALDYDLTDKGALKSEDYINGIQEALLLPPDLAQVVAAQYPVAQYDNPDSALAAVGTDAAFACPGLREAGLLAQYVPTYAYEFADANAPQIFLPPVDSFDYGPTHTAELAYLFDFFSDANLVQSKSFDPDQEQLSEDMITYWTRFASTGNPNPDTGAATFWPQFQQSGAYLSLEPPNSQTNTNIAAQHNCQFWSRLRMP